MTAFFIYLLQVIACSALFAGCYWLFLRNERFYISKKNIDILPINTLCTVKNRFCFSRINQKVFGI